MNEDQGKNIEEELKMIVQKGVEKPWKKTTCLVIYVKLFIWCIHTF